MKTAKRFHTLDSFRGLCALSVVVFHLHVANSVTELQFFRNAEIFVEFFFVLSGFVLAHAYGSQQEFDTRRFFISRSFRLFPLHLFVLATFACLELAKLAATYAGAHFATPPFSGPNAASELIANALLVQAWTPWTENLSFNYPSWSISIEYYMYLIFACSLFLSGEKRHILWLLISVTFFLILYFSIDFPTVYAARGLSCFFAGTLALLAFKALQKKIKPNRNVFTVIEALLLTSIIAELSFSPKANSLLCSILFFCCTIVFAFEEGMLSKLLQKNFFLLLGRLSFSIYLIHTTIIFIATLPFNVVQKISGASLIKTVGEFRVLDLGSSILNNLVVAFILILVVIASHATYIYIELKGQEIGKKITRRLTQRIEPV